MTAQRIPVVTICVLTYGDHLELVQRAVDSILKMVDRSQFDLVVGANAVGTKTESYLVDLHSKGSIDRLILSEENINKCPMMRRMFEGIETEFVWWFDDDSFITDSSAWDKLLSIASSSSKDTVMWGKAMFIDWNPESENGTSFASQFVRSASWYRGLTPPSWDLGGKGEMNFNGQSTGNGRWDFIVGGCWLIRSSTIESLDWPDPRLLKGHDDVYLGEAIRQNGWAIQNVDLPIEIDGAERRGSPGYSDPESINTASFNK